MKRYTIDIAEGGEEAITCRLEFPASDREELYREYLHNAENIKNFVIVWERAIAR